MMELKPEEQNLPPWFREQHYDESYASVLLNLVKQTVANARQVVTLDYVINVVKNNSALQQRIQDGDIQVLLSALVFDGAVIEYFNQQLQTKCYLFAQQNAIQNPYF